MPQGVDPLRDLPQAIMLVGCVQAGSIYDGGQIQAIIGELVVGGIGKRDASPELLT